MSSRNLADKTTAEKPGGWDKGPALAKMLEHAGSDKGKSRFYRESIHLTQSMVDGQLLGHGSLVLGAKTRDYGEPRFYLGLSSSEATDAGREESYHIARSLGVPSEAQLVCGFDFHQIGLLPGENSDAIKFMEHCQKAFAAPEIERDLLKVGGSNLAEAASFHLASVSKVPFSTFISYMYPCLNGDLWTFFR